MEKKQIVVENICKSGKNICIKSFQQVFPQPVEKFLKGDNAVIIGSSVFNINKIENEKM